MKSIKVNNFHSVDLIGHNFKTSNELGFNQLIENHINNNEGILCLSHYNLNGLAISISNPELRNYYDFTEYSWIDGMPIVFMLKALGYKIPTDWRLTFLDWQHSFFELANKNQWKIFILGSTEIDNENFIFTMQEKYPAIAFKGHHGFIEKNMSVIEEINSFRPNILLVGMGMPTQEIWIDKYHSKTNAQVIMPLGGYFDYISGKTYSPPRIAGKLGLEWFFRLIADPKRLAYRYLIEPWPVLLVFIKSLLKTKI